MHRNKCAMPPCASLVLMSVAEHGLSISVRAMQGFATQIFTEVGNYYMPFDKQHLVLRQRLATVACAVSVDYDYYSHRAGGGGWLWPIAIFGGGNDD